MYTWIAGWRPLNGILGCVWLFGRQVQNPVCAGISLRPIGCTPALSVTQSAAAAAVCCLWRYISVICLCLLLRPLSFQSLSCLFLSFPTFRSSPLRRRCQILHSPLSITNTRFVFAMESERPYHELTDSRRLPGQISEGPDPCEL